ncbi:Redoxin [Novipirellula galeiformis]|uniref:Redoxin n=1 Tax=Novipirellula galeiformis TaxID=2528004 RepID=A0A5C6CDJ9_9BACT|nr:redoxin family protein [Novipirellula galeiformis]TWU21554.1 Redoxin [Novipirellula galeiformis]
MKTVLPLAFAALVVSTTLAVPAVAQSSTQTPVAQAKRLLAPGNTAKDFQLRSVGGELSGNVRLSDVNAEGTVVVVVLRGFPGRQCPACSAQVADFVKNADKFAAKKARVLLIYPGAKSQLDQHAGDFLQGTKLPKPLTFLLDPGYQFTNAYGLRWNAVNETSYPSTLVVDKSGKITYAKISETHGGRATTDEILAAL